MQFCLCRAEPLPLGKLFAFTVVFPSASLEEVLLETTAMSSVGIGRLEDVSSIGVGAFAIMTTMEPPFIGPVADLSRGLQLVGARLFGG